MESKKRGNILSVVLYNIIFILLSIFAVNVAYAYFTATASKGGDVSFASLSLNLLDQSDEVLSGDNFTTYLNEDLLLPGDTITFDNIKVENASNVSSYALVNLNIDVIPTDITKTTLTYNKWYNLSGQEVDTNFVNTDATLMASNEDKTLDINFTFPGEDITNDYKNAKTRVTLGAYGTQENLRDSQAYVSKTKYASYHIIKNANRIQEQIPSKNLFNINESFSSSSAASLHVENDKIYCNPTSGNSLGGVHSQFIKVHPNKPITISYTCEQGSPRICFRMYDSNKTLSDLKTFSGWSYNEYYKGFFIDSTSATFTVPGNVYYIQIVIIAMNGEKTNIYSNFQVEKGITATEYEPYTTIDFAYGKNLFNEVTPTSNAQGVSVDYNENTQIFTVNGVTTAACNVVLSSKMPLNVKAGEQITMTTEIVGGNVDRNGQYIYYSLYSTGSNSTYIRNTNSYLVEKGKISVTANMISGTTFEFYIQCGAAGVTFNNLQVRVQIEKGATSTSYWPYGDLVDPLRKVGVGKNLLKPTNNVLGSINISTGGINSLNYVLTTDYISLKAGTYTISYKTGVNIRYVAWYNQNEEIIGNVWSNRKNPFSFTLNSNYLVRFDFERVGNVAIENLDTFFTDYEVQLEKGSTATAYEAYKGVEDTYDESTQTITRNTYLIELTGDELYSNYPYQGLNGCYISNILPESVSRAPGYCSHETQVGHFYNTYGHYMWLGVGNKHVYWIGILDHLGLSTAAELKEWVKNEYNIGNPVTIVLGLQTPVTQVVG